MTREEKINTLKAIIQECEEYQWQRKETLFEIIKDLEQIPKLQNRCHVLTHGVICGFCPYECEYRSEAEPQESGG